jgi:hypothetical protein
MARISNTHRVTAILGASAFFALLPDAALAYIGPGAGITAIGTVLALVSAFVLAIVGFVFYPIKRLLKKNKQAKSETGQ